MILRRDHIAGSAVLAAGTAVLAVSGDLPFGSLASPGAGMLPTLVIGLMMAFAGILFAQAGDGPPLAAIGWDELPHASSVIAVAAACIALYTTLGFLAAMPLLLFGLLFIVERRHFVHAAVFSIGVTVLAYVLFATLLKVPLPRGLIGY